MTYFTKQELNPEQSMAAYSDPKGVLLIKALAGSGKTRVLRYRVPHILKVREAEGDKHSKILLMAFTRPVAQELREYFDRSLSAVDKKRVEVRTCHGMGMLMLYRFKKHTPIGTEEFDIPKPYHLLDAIADHCKTKYKTYLEPGSIKLLLGLQAEAAGLGQPVDTFLRNSPVLPFYQKSSRMSIRDTLMWMERITKFRMENGLLTHDDTLPLANELPSDSFKALGFKDVLADELQDLNFQQRKFIGRFMEHAISFTGVGDSFQSIFGFSGSDQHIFDNMTQQYEGSKMTSLAVNYRSTEPILNLSNLLLSKELGADVKLIGRGADGPQPAVYKDGSASVVEWIKKLRAVGEPWKDIAVLYRTKADAPELEAKLTAAGIPYVLKDNSFFQEPIVQDVISYLNVLYNPIPSLGDWRRLFHHQDGLGYTTADEVWARTKGKPIYWPLGDVPEAVKRTRATTAWLTFTRRLNELYTTENPKTVVKLIQANLQTYWNKTHTDGGRKGIGDRLKLVTSFSSWIDQFPPNTTGWDIVKTISEIENGSKKDKDTVDAVQILTAHKSKGLQWNSVGIWNVADGLFPLTGDGINFEEEKRLLYVACTRAKTNLAVFCPNEHGLKSTLAKYLNFDDIGDQDLVGPFRKI